MTAWGFLDDFRVVLVTGPQRSGTTIAAKMIANDTGRRFVLEEAFNCHDRDAWCGRVQEPYGSAIQCPTMCRYVHEFGDCDDVAVILMRRDLNDILASQKRINWSEAEQKRELARYGKSSGNIAVVKYQYWEETQRDLIRNSFEMEYESLSDHPLWIPKSQRVNFHARQTEL